jgi:hypothetical protein
MEERRTDTYLSFECMKTAKLDLARSVTSQRTVAASNNLIKLCLGKKHLTKVVWNSAKFPAISIALA